jgi:hypothetical protein
MQYPPTSQTLYNALYSIGTQRIDARPVNTPNFHIHTPNNFEKIHLSKNRDIACRVGGSAQQCANASAELEMHKRINDQKLAEILPAHGQLPSHVHLSNHVVGVPESSYNKQLSLESIHSDLKHKFPQSYGFFTEPWTIRTQVCSGVDCRQSDMILDRPLPQNCTRPVRKF